MAHNTAQNNSGNLCSYPPDNHHCSDIVCRRAGGWISYVHKFCSLFYFINFLSGFDAKLDTNLPYHQF